MDRRKFLKTAGQAGLVAGAGIAALAVSAGPAQAVDFCSGSAVKGFWYPGYRAYCPNHGYRGPLHPGNKDGAIRDLQWHRNKF